MLTLGLIFLITLGLSGLAIENLTVMNVGFASILIGLSVDYGVLVYQSTLRNPGDAKKVRNESQRGILCAAATTAAAFAALIVSALPGLSELGVLVAIGIAVGAGVMLTLFVSVMEWVSGRWLKAGAPIHLPQPKIFSPPVSSKIGWGVLGLLIVALGAVVTKGLPPMDASPNTMRPRVSEAYDALDAFQVKMLGHEEMGHVLVRNSDAGVIREELQALETELTKRQEAGEIEAFMMPVAFVPNNDYQQANLNGAANTLDDSIERLRKELDEAGFTESAAGLLNGVQQYWNEWKTDGEQELVLPETRSAKWMIDRMIKVSPEGEVLAAGSVAAAPGTNLRNLQKEDVLLADWQQAMLALKSEIPRDTLQVFGVLAVFVLVMLVYTFRRLQDVIWVIVSISLSLISLLGVMALLGWTWNFFNMAAILLTLGAGLDYSIHMLLGLRRHGDVARVQYDTGQALLVCGLSTVAGFGSLGMASNLGLATLGRVCALGPVSQRTRRHLPPSSTVDPVSASRRGRVTTC